MYTEDDVKSKLEAMRPTCSRCEDSAGCPIKTILNKLDNLPERCAMCKMRYMCVTYGTMLRITPRQGVFDEIDHEDPISTFIYAAESYMDDLDLSGDD